MDWADKKAEELIGPIDPMGDFVKKNIAQALREAYVRGIVEGDGLSVRKPPATTLPDTPK